ncbi:MAG: cupredoxin domain-containing protein [Alphaproteobacteria bacterium]|nr:cupredoxin domain-containing protein [Alphaproteobacteria bacterium]
MKKVLILTSLFVFVSSVSAYAQDYQLNIKDHKFTPETLEIPAGKKVKIVIKNQDATPEEFESYELNREKIIKGNSEVSIFVGPLKAGSYPFFGEFHKEIAKGQIIVK